MPWSTSRLRQVVAAGVCLLLLAAAPVSAGDRVAPAPEGKRGGHPKTAATATQTGPRFGPLRRTVLPGRYIVELTSATERDDVVREYGAAIRLTRRYKTAVTGFAARMDAETAGALREDPRVTGVESDELLQLSATQASPVWGLDRIDQPRLALDRTYTYAGAGKGVTAYVVDSGVYRGHVDFQDRVRKGYDATRRGSTSDCDGHGTHVAATIGGRRYGVAKSVTIVPVRVAGCSAFIHKAHVLAGLDYVARHHRRGRPAVANLSLGGPPSGSVDRAVQRVIDDGVVVITAAGNSSADACGVSPARLRAAVTVGAVNRNDDAPYWSNYGPCLDLFAPGTAITSAGIASRRASQTWDGTSMAAPHVAGAAARLLGRRPRMSPATVAARLRKTATNGLVAYAGQSTTTRLLYVRAARPTRLRASLAASRVLRGDRAEIRGMLRNAVSGVPISGKTVSLSKRRVGGSRWERITSARTDSAGRVRFTQRPLRAVDYRLRHGRTSTTRARSSGIVRVRMDPRSRVTIDAVRSDGSITAGESSTLTATLRRSDGTPQGGQVLTLHAMPATSSVWAKLAQQTTNSQGRVAFAHSPSRNIRYEVRHAGSTATAPAASTQLPVEVSFAIASTLSATTTAPGASVTLSGKVAPAPFDGWRFAALWSSSDAGSWQLVTAVPFDTSGAFSVPITAPQSGSVDYQVRRTADAANAAGAGPIHTLAVNTG